MMESKENCDRILTNPSAEMLGNALLNRLPKNFQSILVRDVNRYYRGNLSEAKRFRLKEELIMFLCSTAVFDVILHLTKYDEFMSAEDNRDIWEINSGAPMDTDSEPLIPYEVCPAKSSLRGGGGYPYYDDMYGYYYNNAIMDCITTVDTENGKVKQHTTYLENFDIHRCIDADEEELANRFLTHLADIYYWTLKTIKKNKIRKKLNIIDLTPQSENTDDTEPSDPIENLPATDIQARMKLVLADIIEDYLSGYPRLITQFCEKHRKIRSSIPFERMFYTEEVIHILHETITEILYARKFSSESVVMENVPHQWIDYLMKEDGCRTYLQIHRTPLKSWKDLFGEDRFTHVSQQHWNQEIPLVKRYSNELENPETDLQVKVHGNDLENITADFLSKIKTENTLLDYRIYEKYFQDNNMTVASRKTISTYHSSFNKLLNTYRRAIKNEPQNIGKEQNM